MYEVTITNINTNEKVYIGTADKNPIERCYIHKIAFQRNDMPWTQPYKNTYGTKKKITPSKSNGKLIKATPYTIISKRMHIMLREKNYKWLALVTKTNYEMRKIK